MSSPKYAAAPAVELLQAKYEALLARVALLETQNSSGSSGGGSGKKVSSDKKKREPTAYNLFLKEKIAELKETHPDLTAPERMKEAALLWKMEKDGIDREEAEEGQAARTTERKSRAASRAASRATSRAASPDASDSEEEEKPKKKTSAKSADKSTSSTLAAAAAKLAKKAKKEESDEEEEKPKAKKTVAKSAPKKAAKPVEEEESDDDFDGMGLTVHIDSKGKKVGVSSNNEAYDAEMNHIGTWDPATKSVKTA